MVLLAMAISASTVAQVSSYTFTASVGAWQPIAGNGTPLGMAGLPAPFTFDDNSFVTQGDQLPLGTPVTGNGWPIGFTFHFNGQAYDRVGLSMEGWLAFGSSSDGLNAVYVPVGSEAYTPLSSTVPDGVSPARRNRVAGFAMDLAALGNGGSWPVQIRTSGQAPYRSFTAEWNVVRSGGSSLLSFQVRLNEGGGDPSAQTVQVIYGGMTQSATLNGQVGLGGMDPSDFNNRAVSVSPFDWMLSQTGSTNTATCRPPAQATGLPQGLTFTWSPPACSVNGIQVTGLVNESGAISGTLAWSPVNGATSYDFVITTGAPTAPAVLSGSNITGTSVALTGLPTGQVLFAYVRANCGPGDTGWGGGHPFTTDGIVQVVCGQAPMQFEHCYADLEERHWYYTGTGNAPLRMMIHAGTIHNSDLLVVHDGPTDQSPVLFSSATGDIAGQVITSSGPQMTMRLIADAVGSCAVHEFITPMEWEVGCLDCDPVLATFQVVDDCTAGQFSVSVQVFNLGSSPTVAITNDGGAPVVTATSVGQYLVGPFSNGSTVVVTAEHATNVYCSTASMALTNGACPVVSCGPDTYTYCYQDSDDSKQAYQGLDPGDRIGIRFLSGNLAAGDVVTIYDGLDEFTSAPIDLVSGADLTGRLFVSSVTSNTIMMHLIANGSQSCASGNVVPWTYVVACYDGCAAPQATFAVVDDCEQGQYSVQVSITALGTADQVVILNDGGVPSLSVTTAGTYTIGPFLNGSSVIVELEGASELCSINSNTLTDGCGVGIEEVAPSRLRVYPDPGEGVFNLMLPHGFGGGYEVEVLDLAGRRMQLVRATGTGGQVIPLDLTDVPAGSYVVIFRDGHRSVSTTVRVMR